MLKEENQESIYRNVFMPSINTLIKTELSGIPVDADAAERFIDLLKNDQEKSKEALKNTLTVQTFTNGMRSMLCAAKNLTLKHRIAKIEEYDHIEFNPASSKQVTQLLYEHMGLPVLNRTTKGLPSTDKDTLEALLAHVDEGTEQHEIVQHLNDLSKCKTLVATFIPILENAIKYADGFQTTEVTKRRRIGAIFGNFRIPGTITGRLASSDPNLQNMPSTGTKYAKAFKQCLTAPDGYTIVAVDFDSLEDRIAAKITQDPNKLGVYQEGFDGHSLRAYYYYPDKIPRMEVTPHNINKIAETHPDLRQASKPITFALTYLGTASTLVKNCGLTLDEAERIEASYHELYKVADDYVDERIQQAAKDGYVEGAFGFKLRAEILKKVLLNDKKTPHQIQKYTRTLGNMLGQSYGLLNSRAANQIFCDVTLDHHDIYPIAQIHDSQYYIVKDDPMTIYELCEALKKAISWNKLPELQQDTIELSGTPQISFTNWADLQDILYTTYDEFIEQYTLKKSL
jgi:DNA polymerase-1